MALSDLNEARNELEACLTEEMKKEYFALLRKWFLFSSPITKEHFDSEARKILITTEQIRCHNYFILAILAKCSSNNKPKHTRSSNEKGGFENIKYSDYLQPLSPTNVAPSEFENRSAAAELFLPDSNFVSCKVAIVAWENGMKGASDKVTDLMVHACQVFVKNIITAMISRKKGYKIRDNKLQFGFNFPIPDPFIRNSNNIFDDTLECKVEVVEDEPMFKPKCKLSLESAEQKTAFAYSCAKKPCLDNSLTVKLLYDTIRNNPNILGLHSISSINTFKLSLQTYDENSD
ncbi:unnamed protein product [Diabrotica balteata]|uniref:Transcriptional adapter 1-like protein n=1 Tax=Diabrotica balteata TaxID=107213 RepID=A0A9P0GY08_DIABA|nr:unnamed protein product [Diabrotica balteata]